jgi:hypothetical protein
MIAEYARLGLSEVAELRRLLAAKKNKALRYVEDVTASSADVAPGSLPRRMDLDKAWDAIRYLLDRAGPPPVDVVTGGSALTDKTWVYDSPRLLSPDEVVASAQFLDTTPFERLIVHFDAAALDADEVYPGDWEDEDDASTYLAACYRSLTGFFARAAADGEAVLVWIA